MPDERWLTRGELARKMSCSEDLVDKWIRHGVPMLRFGVEKRPQPRFQYSAVIHWLKKRTLDHWWEANPELVDEVVAHVKRQEAQKSD